MVDDHQVNQQLAVMMIERLGHCVDVAANGQEALDALNKIPYALVFMDCHMPLMDGYEATNKIRERESVQRVQKEENSHSTFSHTPDSIPHLPIIAMTANAMPEDRGKCLQAGMDDYLTKPIRPEGLSQVLEQWLPSTAAWKK